MQRIPTLRPEIAPAAAGAFFHSMHPSARDAFIRFTRVFWVPPQTKLPGYDSVVPLIRPLRGHLPPGEGKVNRSEKIFL